MSNTDMSTTSQAGRPHVASHSSKITFGSSGCGGSVFSPGSSGTPSGMHIDLVSVILILALCCLFSRNKNIWKMACAVTIVAALIIIVRTLFLC